MEEGIIPAAPRKAFCPPDNCPSSQQCPRCRTNNRGLPRPVLPLPPLESALPQRRRAYNINRAYIPSTRLLSSQPIPSNPFLPAWKHAFCPPQQATSPSITRFLSRADESNYAMTFKFQLLYSLQSHATRLFKIWIKCNKMSPISGG